MNLQMLQRKRKTFVTRDRKCRECSLGSSQQEICTTETQRSASDAEELMLDYRRMRGPLCMKGGCVEGVLQALWLHSWSATVKKARQRLRLLRPSTRVHPHLLHFIVVRRLHSGRHKHRKVVVVKVTGKSRATTTRGRCHITPPQQSRK